MIRFTINYTDYIGLTSALRTFAALLFACAGLAVVALIYTTFANRQDGDNNNICPECGQEIVGYPAVSRKDNTTKICSACGEREARLTWVRYGLKVQKEWLEWQSREGEQP